MNQIKKSENQLLTIDVFRKAENKFYGTELKLKKELDKFELDFIESINYSIVKEIERNLLIDSVFIVVSNNLRALGSKMMAEDQVLLTNDLVEELINDYQFLTIKEFELIIKKGIRKKFDDERVQTIGLSVVNFNFWAKKYFDFKMKMNKQIANKIENEQLEIEKKEVTLESTIEIIRNEYISYQKKYHELKINRSWDNYWLENGCQISSNYLCEKLIQFKKISKLEIEKEISYLIKNGMKAIKAVVEAERRIICKFALKLANAKQNKNGH